MPATPGCTRPEQLEQIKASMRAFGFTNPLLVDEADEVIAGHGRLEAATALGIAKVPVIVLRHLTSAPEGCAAAGRQSHRRERDLGPGAAARCAGRAAGGGCRRPAGDRLLPRRDRRHPGRGR
jgi:hypothetical protein